MSYSKFQPREMSFFLHKLRAVVHRPVHVTLDGDDKQRAAAAAAAWGIKKGLDVL